ncbi:hypothetical protein HBI56_080560 [Parastagonospora nodorum]|uniref:Uncharacterized protein n=1 Tax=Phaeosphaeria nodorum (strain SN15 / ATCC MYA-4574 / FGSC 10173) TaxID=321614 RepID=A0A7U2FJV1_PHANO|nr:hypothetical protein HBH56_106150 [Parastagonospora nodorum]QRD04810.1 hypothetical protein JI435_421760 [Parastagonospora nodorum SN15]KAH3929587.1 hypothetical protein HBH54_124260 [Parastagonospora nodorum]KAH3951464.1 hypothetical protein HBH53_058260 [Parastagonospora nodorum]KAH3975605.1 hypothetical protein HBH52_128610 [Parastagonospora nodorum]
MFPKNELCLSALQMWDGSLEFVVLHLGALTSFVRRLRLEIAEEAEELAISV